MTAEDTVDEVVDHAEELYEAATGRGGMGFAVGAFLLGTGVGGGLAYLLTRRQLEVKYAKFADEEIAEMREHYRDKIRAFEAQAAKRPVDEIVKERGYVSPDSKTSSPPMAVQPPTAVVEESEGSTSETRQKAAEEPKPDPQVRNIFRDRQQQADTVEHEWNYHEERRRRSPDTPYVIHYDERDEMPGYQVVTLTYYEGDDVMCNERDEIIDQDQRNELVGERNLERFGHGSNDPSVVYVRNDKLEIVYEVVKSPNTYAEEVHGFSHDSGFRGNLERMRARERDDPEE